MRLLVCPYFGRAVFVNMFWLAFLEHFFPVVPHACLLPVELNLGSYLSLEENVVSILSLASWKTSQNYSPFFLMTSY